MYVIEVQRTTWLFWTRWRAWNGGRQRYARLTDAAAACDLLGRVWPGQRFRVRAVPHSNRLGGS